MPYALAGIVVGLIIEVPTMLLAIASAGAGHGDYLWAKLFFPATMASTIFTGEISTLGIIFALVQFPAYGLLVGYGLTSKKRFWTAVLVAVFHVVMVLASMGNPNFS